MTMHINGNTYDRILGIDVDKRNFSLTCISDQLPKKQLRIPASSRGLLNYVRNHFSRDRILFVYEAGPTGWGLFDDIKKHHYDCLVTHPASISIPYNRIVKNNRLDSQSLAEQVKAGTLQGIRVPSEPFRNLRHLMSLRCDCAKTNRELKQKIRSLLLFEGASHLIPESAQAWNAHHRSKLTQIPLPQAAAYKLKILAQNLELARLQLLEVHKQIRSFCLSESVIQKNLQFLQSIPGIGPVIAPALLARIGDPANLRNVRELGAFCGLVPRESSTGDTIRRGHISHQGDRVLRGLLIEAAWVTIRKDKELANFYHRIKSKRNEQGGAQIAITAVARKLTARIYVVLKEQRIYEIR